MSEKESKEKLGRNPFEQKKPAKKHKPYEPPERVRSGIGMQESEVLRTDTAPAVQSVRNPLINVPKQAADVPAAATLTWLFVDFWSSTFFEPMFFWMNSPKIVRETIKAASGRGA